MVLRKGCSDTCILRPSLQSIESAAAQGHATVFLAKFFGRAGLISFISAVPHTQRPALFQSLLFEAAGRTVNPVNGSVGLLSAGNWHVCQAAVETVLRGGALKPLPEFMGDPSSSDPDDSSCTDMFKIQDEYDPCRSTSLPKVQKRRRSPDDELDLSLSPDVSGKKSNHLPEKRRRGSPSTNSEESLTTTCENQPPTEIKLLNLF
ncbi:hypothetical protein ACP275_08G057200 [Erythranthe tilingii]